jgi:UDP-N-acetylglucosamine acyltransferase
MSPRRYDSVCIHPTAEIAPDVEIGPFSVIGPSCRIASGTWIANNVTLYANVCLGADNKIYPGAVLGGLPQDKKYEGEESQLLIGSGNVIREHVTINSGTRLGAGKTVIGDRNLIMGGCHIAHDCILESGITMANNVLLGGHVLVKEFASFGGLAAVHHFVTISRYAFVGGLTRVIQDVPPFMLLEGNPSRVWSINRVGLRRRGFDGEALRILKLAHRRLFRSQKPIAQAMEELVCEFPESPEIEELAGFVRDTLAGNQGRARQPMVLEDPPEDWSG